MYQQEQQLTLAKEERESVQQSMDRIESKLRKNKKKLYNLEKEAERERRRRHQCMHNPPCPHYATHLQPRY